MFLEEHYVFGGKVRISTSAATVPASVRCFIVAKISWRSEGKDISAKGIAGGGVMGLEGE